MDFETDKTMSMMLLMKWMLDWHPYIFYFIKIFSKRDLNSRSIDQNGRHIWNEVRESNNISLI